MSNLAGYVDPFFESLSLGEDAKGGHSYRSYIRAAVDAFLARETEDSAFEVYRIFFDAYRITLPGNGNPFVDLVDILRAYEQTAATLIDKQRDHFVHMVNVFLTGLSLWQANASLRAAFEASLAGAPRLWENVQEEFFFRWGVAALFHDVGYPIEIAGKQIDRFVGMVADADGSDRRVRARIGFENFDELNSIRALDGGEGFEEVCGRLFPDDSGLGPFSPHDLLAQRIEQSWHPGFSPLKQAIDGAVASMADSGFVDHGYYSALIVLKWYGYAIQAAGEAPEKLYGPVLDAAAAIFLHNWWGNALQKAPFFLGPMELASNPIAYLLILCDELQEWNRTARGIVTRTFTLADTVDLSLGPDSLFATYVTRRGRLPEGFCDSKVALLRERLAIDDAFGAGFGVDAESLESFWPLSSRLESVSARPLLKDIELLAIAIHADYNAKQLERHPDRPLAYGRFSELPDDLKYSNLRQAQGIYDKLEAAGYTLRPKGAAGAVSAFSDDLVEALAELEHEEWMAERLRAGWTLGERDVEHRRSPYLVPYGELPDDIKELDRDTVRNIFSLADRIGMAVYGR